MTGDLLIGASPQHLPAVQFLQGEIAEILIYTRALDNAERQQTREYLAAKYELTVAEDSRRMVVIDNGYLPVLVENPSTPETRTLTTDGLECLERTVPDARRISRLGTLAPRSAAQAGPTGQRDRCPDPRANHGRPQRSQDESRQTP